MAKIIIIEDLTVKVLIVEVLIVEDLVVEDLVIKINGRLRLVHSSIKVFQFDEAEDTLPYLTSFSSRFDKVASRFLKVMLSSNLIVMLVYV